MKKLVALFGAILILSMMGLNSYGQKLEAQNTYELTGKAKRGALANVGYDGSQYKLTYITKSTDTKIKMQHYFFDNDFNFIKMEEEEDYPEKLAVKYTWYKWNGEWYSVEGNYVEPNLTGTLVLKRKKTTYKYDWILLGYYKTVEILDKVKPKTDDGRKFYYFAHAEDDKTGDIYVLCGVKANLKDVQQDKSAAYRHNMDMTVMKFNSSLELVKEVPIKFEFPNQHAFVRAIGNASNDFTTPEIGGMAFIFAPIGGPGINKYADPGICNYRYVRVDHDLNIIDDIKFESGASYWKIDEMVPDISTGDVYFYGPSAEGKDKYYNMSLAITKFKAVQLLKVSNHKVSYLTETNLEEFEAKLKCPPSQKKSPAYAGKKFEIANYKLASNGDFFVLGQNKDDKGFKDVLSFHFDKNGVLKSQYGIDLNETNDFSKVNGAPQIFFESPTGKNMYWLIQEIRGVTTWTEKPLTYPRLGTIEVETGNISDFTQLGKVDKNVYYLDPNYPYLETNKGNRIAFFGSDKSGKNIWFCRVSFDE
ncbi:MAG: hypothetical protein ABIJ97_10510 [Bacteroidota bacterium]